MFLKNWNNRFSPTILNLVKNFYLYPLINRLKSVMHRRHFLKSASAAAGSAYLLYNFPAFANSTKALEVACQWYTWFSYFRREGKEWSKDLDASLKAFTSSGLQGFEPNFESTEEVEQLQPHLKKHGIWSKSLYVNSTLHEAAEVEKSMASVLSIAKAAKAMGVEIVVTNPSPIQWGGPQNKNDEQLKVQAQALDQLGADLRQLGLKLAYHTHDPEMREGAREFHHMLVGTAPENVHLCLDAHWIYRGAGNSQVALFDIVNLYADRIVELHLRQSHEGIWSEVFEAGDIDYERLAEMLLSKNLHPHVVLEQAVEEGTPQTLSAVEANRKSLAYVHEVFNKLAG
jgi:inosose dehydratase